MANIKSIQGSLNNNDDFILNNVDVTPILADEFELNINDAVAQDIIINLSSRDNSFDPFLEVIDPNTGKAIEFDDDSGDGNNAQINGINDFTIPNDGKLRIRVTNSFGNPVLAEENPYILDVSLPSDNIDVQLQPINTIFSNPIKGLEESPAIIEGQLNKEDFNFSYYTSNTKADEYKLESTAFNDNITISLTTKNLSNTNFDPLLDLQIIDADTGSRFYPYLSYGNTSVTASLTVLEDTNYIIRVTGLLDSLNDELEKADYELKITPTSGEVTVSPRIPVITPNITISDAVTKEGNDGTKLLSFDVTLSEAINFPVTVNYATQDDTAKANENDYTAITTTELTFEPGELTKTINVRVSGDNDNTEADEKLFVNLISATNANITDNRGIGTIEDDDNDDNNGDGGINPTTPPTALELTGGTAQIAYVAYYGRPADNGGLTFWNNDLTNNNISYAPRNGDRLIEQEQDLYNRIVNNFGNSDEANRLFGDSSNRDRLNQVYQFVFDRDGDEAGLNFWEGQIDNGNVTLATFALEVALGAQNDDIVTLNNKITSADLFSNSIDNQAEIDAYGGSSAEIFGRNWLDNFGDTISTQAQVDAALADLIG